MTIGLTGTDADYLIKGIFGPVIKVVKTEAGIRQQGNGNFTGLIRKTYDNGEVITSEFVMNAKSREDVVKIYHELHS